MAVMNYLFAGMFADSFQNTEVRQVKATHITTSFILEICRGHKHWITDSQTRQLCLGIHLDMSTTLFLRKTRLM